MVEDLGNNLEIGKTDHGTKETDLTMLLKKEDGEIEEKNLVIEEIGVTIQVIGEEKDLGKGA